MRTLRKKNVLFSVRDLVFLKVFPMKGVMRFGKKGKASSKVHWAIRDLIDSWWSGEQIGVNTRVVASSSSFSTCRWWESISQILHIPQSQAVELSKDLTYEEFPVAIVDRQIRQLRTKEIPMVKVLWSNHTVKHCTWETEALMWEAYPYLFQFWICTSFIY